jgi:hypothetical protein
MYCRVHHFIFKISALDCLNQLALALFGIDREEPMIVVFISIALVSQFGSPLGIPVGDRPPVINVEKTCKDSVAADKATNLALAQPFENCMRDENYAKQQVGAVWSTYPAPVRERCEQEATLLGEGSYVDLLSCMQMTDPAKLTPTMDLRGASKNRNKN